MALKDSLGSTLAIVGAGYSSFLLPRSYYKAPQAVLIVSFASLKFKIQKPKKSVGLDYLNYEENTFPHYFIC